jgi:hypothetical protein
MPPPSQYIETWSSSTPHSYDPANLPLAPKIEPGQILERANESPVPCTSGGMVNIINAISGGSDEPVHEMKRQ